MQKELTDVIYSIQDKDWFPQVQSHNVLMLILWDKILCSNVQANLWVLNDTYCNGIIFYAIALHAGESCMIYLPSSSTKQLIDML